MPDLNDKIHLQMRENAISSGQIDRDGVYGLHWGDPQKGPLLREARMKYIYPYLHPDHRAIEIGPGGGRWTRYLLGFGELIGVDYHQELLDELTRNFKAPHLKLVKNNGTDFPGVEDKSVDFIFSWGVFVHLDPPIIQNYLHEMRRVLKPGGNAVIHYADKTKPEGRDNPGFSDNSPEKMRGMIAAAGLELLEEETEPYFNCAVSRFTSR